MLRDLQTSDWIAIVSLFVSVITLYVTYSIFEIAQKRSLPQEANRMQLEFVIAWVHKLKNYYPQFSYVKVLELGKASPEILDINNVFNIDLKHRPKRNLLMIYPSYDGTFVYFPETENLLMPKEIIAAWKKLVGGIKPKTPIDFKNYPVEVYCYVGKNYIISQQAITRVVFKFLEGLINSSTALLP